PTSLLALLYLTIRVAHAGLSLLRELHEATPRADIIVQRRPLLVQHTSRCIHRARHPRTRLILGDPHRIARLHDDVVAHAMILHRLRQIDVDPPTTFYRSDESNPFGVGSRAEPSGALDDVDQALILGGQR